MQCYHCQHNDDGNILHANYTAELSALQHIKYSGNLYNDWLKYFLNTQRSPNTTSTILVGVAAPPVQPFYIVLATPSRKPHTMRSIRAS